VSNAHGRNNPTRTISLKEKNKESNYLTLSEFSILVDIYYAVALPRPDIK